MQLLIYRSQSRKTRGQFGWRLLAKNGKSIAVGGELYKRRADMMRVLQNIFLSSWADMGRDFKGCRVFLTVNHPRKAVTLRDLTK